MPPKTREELSENFSRFLEVLDVERYDFVAEFRDESWLNEEIFRLLRKYNVAYCIVDEPLLPPVIEVTGRVAYVRWHGRGSRPWYYYEYREDELKEWVPRLNKIASKVEILYGYFNNHFRGYAPKNALQMLKLLNSINSRQKQALNQILEYFDKEFIRIIKEKGHETILAGDLNAMLSLFMDKRRLERALEEKDNVKIIVHENNILAGAVKDYSFKINLIDKTIIHDCEDWRKRLSTKQFCKHIGGVFLYLAKDDATSILKDIITNIDEWKFQTQ
ncbi:MAG: DUF72 domain-containing protein, partial [Nitrososphaeria archaeon]|nr:DUF72 domain-containing protein [Nitrososphaeria archaeon]